MGNQTVSYFASLIRGSHILDHKEKEILINRLQKKTLKKIGKKYKVSDERIRQIEFIAIKKFFKKTIQLLLFD